MRFSIPLLKTPTSIRPIFLSLRRRAFHLLFLVVYSTTIVFLPKRIRRTDNCFKIENGVEKMTESRKINVFTKNSKLFFAERKTIWHKAYVTESAFLHNLPLSCTKTVRGRSFEYPKNLQRNWTASLAFGSFVAEMVLIIFSNAQRIVPIDFCLKLQWQWTNKNSRQFHTLIDFFRLITINFETQNNTYPLV